MSQLIFHNPFLRGIGILLLIELFFLIQMIRHRKPGVSRVAAIWAENSLTEPGLRAKRRCDFVSGIVAIWVLVALVIGAVKMCV